MKVEHERLMFHTTVFVDSLTRLQIGFLIDQTGKKSLYYLSRLTRKTHKSTTWSEEDIFHADRQREIPEQVKGAIPDEVFTDLERYYKGYLITKIR